MSVLSLSRPQTHLQEIAQAVHHTIQAQESQVRCTAGFRQLVEEIQQSTNETTLLQAASRARNQQPADGCPENSQPITASITDLIASKRPQLQAVARLDEKQAQYERAYDALVDAATRYASAVQQRAAREIDVAISRVSTSYANLRQVLADDATSLAVLPGDAREIRRRCSQARSLVLQCGSTGR